MQVSHEVLHTFQTVLPCRPFDRCEPLVPLGAASQTIQVQINHSSTPSSIPTYLQIIPRQFHHPYQCPTNLQVTVVVDEKLEGELRQAGELKQPFERHLLLRRDGGQAGEGEGDDAGREGAEERLKLKLEVRAGGVEESVEDGQGLRGDGGVGGWGEGGGDHVTEQRREEMEESEGIEGVLSA